MDFLGAGLVDRLADRVVAGPGFVDRLADGVVAGAGLIDRLANRVANFLRLRFPDRLADRVRDLFHLGFPHRLADRVVDVLGASLVDRLADRVVASPGLIDRLAHRVASFLGLGFPDRLAHRVVDRLRLRFPDRLADRVGAFAIARFWDVLDAVDRFVFANCLVASLVAGVLLLLVDRLLARLHDRMTLLFAAGITGRVAARRATLVAASAEITGDSS